METTRSLITSVAQSFDDFNVCVCSPTELWWVDEAFVFSVSLNVVFGELQNLIRIVPIWVFQWCRWHDYRARQFVVSSQVLADLCVNQILPIISDILAKRCCVKRWNNMNRVCETELGLRLIKANYIRWFRFRIFIAVINNSRRMNAAWCMEPPKGNF